MSKLTRREVLKLFLAGAGAALAPWPWKDLVSAATPATPDLVISKGTSPPRITEAAIRALGGMSRFVSRGDVVLVKPNMAWDRKPELAATTNPEVVATLVRLCLEAGAKEVKVFDNPCDDLRRCYVSSGIMAAAKEAGAKVQDIDKRKFRKMDIKGEWLKTWEVYQEAMEVDKIINCPILKHHTAALLTMGMKNLMGLTGGERGQLHWQLDQAIVDLAAFFKPTLVVLDAVRILTANGPQGGEPEVRQAAQHGGSRDRPSGRRCHRNQNLWAGARNQTLWAAARRYESPPYRLKAGFGAHGPGKAQDQGGLGRFLRTKARADLPTSPGGISGASASAPSWRSLRPSLP